MEVELKYLIPDKGIIDEMWDPSVLKKYGEVETHDSIDMKAIYYDTEDGLLSGLDAAFRIRLEGDRPTATLKWGGTQKEALHEREELNIHLVDYKPGSDPSLDVFSESEKGSELIALVGDKKLVERIRTDFTRQIMRIDTGAAICEMALDRGEIITSAGNLEICELEIELYSGEVEELNRIGNAIAERFGLKAGVQSKYGRGLALLRG